MVKVIECGNWIKINYRSYFCRHRKERKGDPTMCRLIKMCQCLIDGDQETVCLLVSFAVLDPGLRRDDGGLGLN